MSIGGGGGQNCKITGHRLPSHNSQNCDVMLENYIFCFVLFFLSIQYIVDFRLTHFANRKQVRTRIFTTLKIN